IPFRVPWRQQVFISWAGLRGAVPIVLATFPIVAGVPGSDQILDIVFVGVVVFTLIQGPSLPIVGRALRLIPRHATRELQVEAAPLDQLDAELLTLAIPPGSRLHGVALFELRLPPPTVVSLIIRNGETIVPERDTRLLTGDELLIVTTSRTREPTARRPRAVRRRRRLAYSFGEGGDPGRAGPPTRRVGAGAGGERAGRPPAEGRRMPAAVADALSGLALIFDLPGVSVAVITNS